jgi:transcriptional regulator with XRE-family HTH domain
MNSQAQIALRARKLGLLIRDARLAARKNVSECAAALGIPPYLFRAYEEGRRAPSLPEVEALAYYFQLPLQHFWTNDVISDNPAMTQTVALGALAGLRDRMVGVLLQQRRQQAGLSIRTLSEQTGISQARLRAYESGDRAVPLPELELIARDLDARLEEFFDHAGPIGHWLNEQRAVQGFLKLPAELRDFVCQPINRPYLDLARNLSSMSTDKLRAVAEGLLDITL